MPIIKFILSFLLLGAIAQSFLPWWSLVVLAALLALVWSLRPAQALSAGLIAGLLLWGSYAGWLNYHNQSLLANKMGTLLGGLSAGTLVALSAVLGGIYSGLAAWVGALARSIIMYDSSLK